MKGRVSRATQRPYPLTADFGDCDQSDRGIVITLIGGS
jgi:hypothetical protein